MSNSTYVAGFVAKLAEVTIIDPTAMSPTYAPPAASSADAVGKGIKGFEDTVGNALVAGAKGVGRGVQRYGAAAQNMAMPAWLGDAFSTKIKPGDPATDWKPAVEQYAKNRAAQVTAGSQNVASIFKPTGNMP